MQWYEAEVRAMEHARDSAPPRCGAVVFYGSSSIRLWSSLRDDFCGVNLVNTGFGGSTLAACVYFFDRLVLPYHPHSVVLYAGDNDLGDGKRPENVRDSFRAFLHKMESLGPIPLGVISIKPSPARWHLRDAIYQTNAMIRQDLLARPSSYYIDIVPAMLNAQGGPRTELYQADGLHLSPEGYQVWTEAVSAYHEYLF